MQHYIQSILVYIIVMAVIRSLVTNEAYLSFFRFTSGLILIVVLMTPVLSLLSIRNTWYTSLEKSLFRVDREEIGQQMEVAQGTFQKNVKKQYENQINSKVKNCLNENGIAYSQVGVYVKWDTKSKGKIERIVVMDGTDTRDNTERVKPIRIVVGKQKEETVSNKKSRQVKKLLSQEFGVSEQAIQLVGGK